jgi:hypothetical protein
MEKIVLEIGRGQRPWGTGVVRGWGSIEDYFRVDVDVQRETNYLCTTCGADIFLIPCYTPYTCTLWICKNGHKFRYENTD